MPVRSLYVKVSLPVAIVVTAATITLTTVESSVRREATTELARARASNLATIAQDAIDSTTPQGHRPDLEAFFAKLAGSPDIAAVRVLDTSGKVLRSARRLEVGQRMTTHFRRLMQAAEGMAVEPDMVSDREVALHTIHPIVNRPKCQSCHGGVSRIGYLEIEVDLTKTGPEAGMARWHALSATLGGLQVLVLLGLTAAGVGLLVVRPVQGMVSVMERMQGGDLDVKMSPVGTRELDILVNGFNSMVARLRAAKQADELSRRAQMERAEQLATVGELAAGLAHEIKNPLSGVKAAVEVLARDYDAVDPKRMVLAQSAAEISRIDRVIRDLLQYARPKAPSLVRVDLNQIVRDSLMLTSVQASAQQIAVECELAGSLPEVEADTAMIRQVLVNLLLNAIHAVEGQVEGALIRVSTRADGDSVVCLVRDNGPGVPASQAEQIFRPFHTSRARGTGLGLSISQRVVEMHRGRLWLENPGEPGASFAFSLPVDAQREVAP